MDTTKNTAGYQPKTGERCGCKAGIERDNCPECEGTGSKIDFRAIREATKKSLRESPITAITLTGVK
jgi:hypothetical protein